MDPELCKQYGADVLGDFMRTPPFDNGKIKMGIYYEPPKYVEQDPDMLEIQKWLIGDPIRLRQEYYIGIAMNVFIGFICLVVVLMYARN